MKLDAMLEQNLLNHCCQVHHRVKWFGVLWLNPVRSVPLHVNDSGIPRMLWDNLAVSLGDVVRPKSDANLDHLFVVSGLSALCVWWHK